MNRRFFVKASAALLSLAKMPFSFGQPFPKPYRSNDDVIYPTGIQAIDDLIGGGLKGGRIYVVHGPPRCGRTALLRRINRSVDYANIFTFNSLDLIEDIVFLKFKPLILLDDFQSMHFDNERERAHAITQIYTFAQLHNVPIVVSIQNQFSHWTNSFELMRPMQVAFYSTATINVAQLDRHGRGKVYISKNRYNNFIGGLNI